MKIFRHLGLMIAVFWCAAMVVAPMAAAAGAGQGMNQGPGAQGMDPGQSNQGNNQMQQGQGAGNGQNNAGPDQGNGPQGMNRTPMSEFRNMTPPGDGDPANMTVANQTSHGHSEGNLTPPPGQPQQNGAGQIQQGNQNLQQGQNQKSSNDSLIAELIDWLKDHGIS